MTNYQQGIKEYLQDDKQMYGNISSILLIKQVKTTGYRTWEIKDQNLPYYLLSDNCALEILVLLNSIFPYKILVNDFLQWFPLPKYSTRMLNRENLILLYQF